MQHSSFYNQLVKDDTLTEFMQQAKEINNVLGSAFVWKDSPSGSDYWYKFSGVSHLSDYDISVLKNEYPEYFI
ncbi:MAG: hypothetical protein PVF17_04490 [Ignavibacteria bacterium]|jgi:hypothetical protein